MASCEKIVVFTVNFANKALLENSHTASLFRFLKIISLCFYHEHSIKAQNVLHFVYGLWALLGLNIVIAFLDYFGCLKYFYPDLDDYNGTNDNDVGIWDKISSFCCSKKEQSQNENAIELEETLNA